MPTTTVPVIAADFGSGGAGVSSNGSKKPSLRDLLRLIRTDIAALFALSPKHFNARGVVTTNVGNLAAFTVAGNDGLTYTAGQVVALVGQSTGSQNGLYVVGTVAGGTAPLTRISGLPSGDAIVNGMVFEVSEGTLWAGSTWKAMCTGACVVGTDDPLFYPKTQHWRRTLVAGKYDSQASDALFLFSTTKSQVTFSRVDANTSSLTTGGYAAPVASRTAGKAGTATLIVRAEVAAGTINTADISTMDIVITNW